MKILHITPAYYPAFKHGGPIESVHLLNKALVKKGIAVDVFTTNAGIDKDSHIELNKWIAINGIRVKYLKYFFYEHYTFSPSLLFAVFKKVKNYDLIHLTGVWNFSVLAGALACMLNNKPFIVSPRGVLYRDAINIKSKFIKLLYFNLIAKHYLKRASAIHYTTEDEKEHTFKKINNTSIVISNGIDLSYFNNLPSKGSFKSKYPHLKDKKYILFLGRIHKQKGIDLLIEAFKLISNKYKDLYLIIAGPDSIGYKKEVERFLAGNNLLNKVVFTGMLSGKDKLAAYVDAEMFVLPSYFENFGMSVIEAMACGIPVIVSNRVGIYKEIEASNAGIVVDLQPENLYKEIKNLLENPNLEYKVSTNGKQLVKEKYDIYNVAVMMYDAYKKIIC